MGNYLNQKITSSKSLPAIKLESKARIRITESFNSLVKYLCNEINTIEWSGILFFDTEGDLNTPEGLTITPIDIYPMDKGSTGYTEYDFSEQVFDYYDHYPERFGMKYGHIHSHHSMQSFFSGTDVQELIDNCVNHSYYVSLIVNNRNEMVARVAIPGEREINSSSKFSFSGILGKIITIPRVNDVKENVMYYAEMDIEKEAVQFDQFFIDKVRELKERNNHSSFVSTMPFTTGSGAKVSGNKYSQKEFDFTFEEKEVELPVNKVLIECLGGNSHQALTDIMDEILYDRSGKINSDEDIKFYIEQCFDDENIADIIDNYARNPYERTDLKQVLSTMEKFIPILKQYVNSKYYKIVNMSINEIKDNITNIKQVYDV